MARAVKDRVDGSRADQSNKNSVPRGFRGIPYSYKLVLGLIIACVWS